METQQTQISTRRSYIFIALIAIILLAAALRIFSLDKFPPALFGDEIDVGYQAYSLLHTAKDYTGQFLPTYIHSFSEWRAPLLMYATVPFVTLFGLNEWGVRLVPAFFGIVSVLLIYAFSVQLTGSRKVGLAAAFLLAIAPWHLQYSRESYEVTLLLTLLLIGLTAFLKGLTNSKWLLVAAIAIGLMFYTYLVATVSVPLLIIVLHIIYWRQHIQHKDRYSIFAAVLFFVIIMPFAMQSLSGKTGERFSLLSIFNDPKLVNQIDNQRNIVVFPSDSPINGPLKTLPDRLIHNRPMAVGSEFLTNYLSAFSPQFLFLQGDPNLRQSVGGMGELYLFFIPLLGLGVYELVTSHRQVGKLIFGLLLISPIPSALTRDGGTHATRLFLLNLPLVIIAAFGLVFIINKARTRIGQIAVVCFSIFMLANIFVYLHLYYTHNPIDGYPFWQYGYADGLRYLTDHRNEYKQILITNSAEPTLGRTLFYFAYDPATFQQQFHDDKPLPNIMPGFNGFTVGNMAFVSVNDAGRKIGIQNILPKQTAYLISQQNEVGGDWDWRVNPPAGIKVLHTTLDPWQKPLFYVITRQ